MPNSKKNNILDLNIWGGDGYTSLFNHSPLYLKSDAQTKALDLYIKSKPVTPEIKAKTNWDVSLRSYPANEYVANADFEFSWSDYSSHRNDTFFVASNGKIPAEYTISANWGVNDIDSVDDIVAVAVKDWTSTEKIILDTPITRNFYLQSIYTKKVTTPDIVYYPLGSTTYTGTVNDYNFTVGGTILTGDPCTTTSAGTATVQYTDVSGATFTITAALTLSGSAYVSDPLVILGSASLPVVINYTGSGSPCVQTSAVSPDYSQTVTAQDSPPAGAVQAGNSYYYPVTSTISNQKKSRILLNAAYVLGSDFLITNEYLDYSDIFFEIRYSTESSNANYLVTDVTSGTSQTKTYKFGGYITEIEFLESSEPFNDSVYVNQDYELTWKILLDSQGGVASVVLSSYLDWNEADNFSYTLQYYFNPIFGYFNPSDYLVKDVINIAVDDIKVYKIVNFPNCGKVDLYTKITGTIDSTSDNITFTSYDHGLENGDRVKFTSALSNNSGNCELNGAFYIIQKTNNTFKLSYNPSGSEVEFPNLKTVDGIIWSKLSGESGNLRYLYSIYSPCGKNGYSTKPMQLLKYTESSANAGDDIMLRGVEYEAYVSKYTDLYQANYSRQEVRYPQGYFDGRRSWDNFYPLQRFNTEDPTIYGVINGNKFGSCVSIKKYSSNEYIMMVTESGAEESFPIVDFFEYATENQKVIPSYLPYGRIHFYKLTKNPLSQNISIEYLSSKSVENNPWSSYETLNYSFKTIEPFNFINYSISPSYVTEILNSSQDNYWLGARFTSWSNEYVSTELNMVPIPDITTHPYEFSWLNSFGKYADFEIEGDVIYCSSSSNVKNSNFVSNVSNDYHEALLHTFNYNISTDVFSVTSFISIYDFTTQLDYLKQKEEFQRFGTCIIADNNRLIFGWPSEYRNNQYLYYYTRSGSTYSLQQTITKAGNGDFGGYIVSSNDTLATNYLSNFTESNARTTNLLSYVEIYKRDATANQYSFDSIISPTINLSDPLYSNLNPDQYEKTNNLAYDGTSSNSATYIMDLYGKYDLYDNIFVLRDLNELSIFYYNSINNSYENKYHKFFTYNDTDLSTSSSKVIIANSFAPATFDNPGEFDFGEFSQSLQIIDTSTIIMTSELNYVFSSDISYPEYLNLFLLSDPNINNNIDIVLAGAFPQSGDLNLYLSILDQSSGVADLYLYNSYVSQNVNIYLDSMSGYYSNIPLVLSANPIGFTEITTPTGPEWGSTSYSSIGLNIISTHTGIPNGSGFVSLHMATEPYLDHASTFPLILSKDTEVFPIVPTSPTEITTAPPGALFLYIPTYPVHPTSDTYTDGSGFVSLNLCNSPGAGFLDMIVYNIMETGNLPIYMDASITVSGDVNLYTHGFDKPQSGTINFYIKGTKI